MPIPDKRAGRNVVTQVSQSALKPVQNVFHACFCLGSWEQPWRTWYPCNLMLPELVDFQFTMCAIGYFFDSNRWARLNTADAGNYHFLSDTVKNATSGAQKLQVFWFRMFRQQIT